MKVETQSALISSSADSRRVWRPSDRLPAPGASASDSPIRLADPYVLDDR
jgi:hypothetical protein